MKKLIITMLAMALSACASNNNLYSGTPSMSTSTSIPIKDATGNQIGRLYQSVYTSSYGTRTSTSTSLWDVLGTGANVSFNINW